MVLQKRKLDGEYGDWRESHTDPPMKRLRTAKPAVAATDDDWFADPLNGYSMVHPTQLVGKQKSATSPAASRSDDWFVDEQNGYGTAPFSGATRAATQIAAGSSAASTSKKSATTSETGAKSKKAQKEKRGARFRSKCPQNILDRVHRVREQRYIERIDIGFCI